jgi:hypothetical protein
MYILHTVYNFRRIDYVRYTLYTAHTLYITITITIIIIAIYIMYFFYTYIYNIDFYMFPITSVHLLVSYMGIDGG